MSMNPPVQNNPSGNPVWVRLHFVSNADGSEISPPVTGILENESPSQYALIQIVAYRQVDTGVEAYTEGGMDFFNKAYVWRMEVLPEPPQIGLLTDGVEFV